MRKAPSLGQLSGAWDALNWPKGAQSSSTKLASYPPKPRSLCCAFCRNTSFSASAEPAPSELMFELLRLLTATWKLPSLLASSGATYFTGSTYFRLRYPLSEIGTGSIRTDVRVIAATNRDLEAAIAAGLFRSDLFYRLNVFPIEIPPLREREEDIPLLVEYSIDRYARKAGKNFQTVNKESLDQLQSYSWPGNIRELQNVIERSVIVSSGDI